jgi:hypothetical protein
MEAPPPRPLLAERRLAAILYCCSCASVEVKFEFFEVI